jgi:hypothetical protein
MPKMNCDILPRLIRLRDAPRYLGMDPNRFNAEVRPYLTEIPIGKQGVAFDRLDLDAWVDQYKDCNGRPCKAARGGKPWDAKQQRASLKGAAYGTSRKELEEKEFEKVRAQVISQKRKGI